MTKSEKKDEKTSLIENKDEENQNIKKDNPKKKKRLKKT